MNLNPYTETRVTRVTAEINQLIKEIDNLNKLGYINSKERISSSPSLLKILSHYVVDEESHALNTLKDKELKKVIKWCYNKYILGIYLNVLNEEHNLQEVGTPDELLEIKEIKKELYNKLDPIIRVRIMDRGMSVLKNIYSGFDTEYQSVSMTENRLLSVQLAVNTKIILVLPIVTDFEFGRINPHTNEKYNVETNHKKYKYKDLEEDINKMIKEVRRIRYYKKDESLRILIEGLKKRGVSNVVKDDSICFSFDRTPIRTWFSKASEGYSLKEVVKTSNNIAYPDLERSEMEIYEILKEITKNSLDMLELKPGESGVSELDIMTEKDRERITKLEIEEIGEKEVKDTMPLVEKKYTRTNVKSFTSDAINITKKINNYVIGHMTNADLSMLKDFEEFKQELAIVNGCLVTLGKSLFISGVNVHIRDTMLLAPGSKKSLASIGELYGTEFNKINILKEWYEKMEEFMNSDYEGFKRYAIRDSLITLVHASYMEEFSFKQGVLGIPLTLSSLATSYVRKKWKKDGYKGYQMSESLIGEPNDLITPKSLNLSGDASLLINMYVANYKGGRNESFMYGRDNETKWYDYDLTSAYTTAMCLLGNPKYKAGKRITSEELEKFSNNELLYSYTIIRVSFKFDENEIKYPSIPCIVDKGTTVYPLEGKGYLTGAEYLLAKEQGCEMNIEDVAHIPFYREEEYKEVMEAGELSEEDMNYIKSLVYKPYKNCIEELQSSRRQYPKGTINNLIYKDMGNSLYGIVSKGISNKKKYDIKTGESKRVVANDLSNPVMASWITSFIRSVIGEILHNIHVLGGTIVSVTTDGFITDLPDLEDRILSSEKCDSYLLKEYRKIRKELSNDPTALELKNCGKGMLTWTTRGQFSYDANIVATTGLQRRYYSKDELKELLNNTFDSESKLITSLERSLKSGIDLSRRGGSVTPVFRDKTFRMLYDNRRIIVENGGTMLDSKPVKDADQCELIRYISKLPINVEYHKNTSSTGLKYRNYLDIAVRTFIRGLFSNSHGLSMRTGTIQFTCYKDIITFIKEYKHDYHLTENTISQLRRRSSNKRKIVINKDIINFAEYVKERIPEFDKKSFLG